MAKVKKLSDHYDKIFDLLEKIVDEVSACCELYAKQADKAFVENLKPKKGAK